MKTENLLKLIDEHLQEHETDKEKLFKEIDMIRSLLNFNIRYVELSDEEKKDYFNCVNGYPLNEVQIKCLDKCKSETERQHYIDMWARSTYMRGCMWEDYLSCKNDKKPIVLTIQDN